MGEETETILAEEARRWNNRANPTLTPKASRFVTLEEVSKDPNHLSPDHEPRNVGTITERHNHSNSAISRTESIRRHIQTFHDKRPAVNNDIPPPRKRRRRSLVDHELGGDDDDLFPVENLPELDLNLGSDIDISPIRAHDGALKEGTANGHIINGSDKRENEFKGLNFKMNPLPGLKDPKAFTELTAKLKQQEAEIEALKEEVQLAKLSSKKQVASAVRRAHKEYSEQASSLFRVIYKKAEMKAKLKAEEMWKAEVEALRKTIEKERLEKAELVRACDEYLTINGF